LLQFQGLNLREMLHKAAKASRKTSFRKVKAAAAPKPVAAKVPKKENMKKQKNQPKEREKRDDLQSSEAGGIAKPTDRKF